MFGQIYAWLCNDTNKYVETPVMEGLDSMLVRDLITDNGTGWDECSIDSLF
jgi:hypothetical protein